MGATCPTSSSTPRTSPAPCALVPACGLELARSSTAFPKRTLPLTAARAVRKTTSGELVSSPAGWSSRRAITPSPSPAVFSDKNAKNCSLTGRRIGNGCELDFPKPIGPNESVSRVSKSEQMPVCNQRSAYQPVWGSVASTPPIFAILFLFKLLRTLLQFIALSCIHAKFNSPVFLRLRTLCEKHWSTGRGS